MRVSSKFIGTTEQCFRHLLENHPELSTIELIGEFCCIERESANRTAIVQRWQRGEYFPVGLELLRLRCFLHLAGYGVLEFAQLIAEFRSLALAIVLRPLDPAKVNKALGYNDERGTSGLWRILLQGKGYLEDVKKEAAKLVAHNKRYVNPKIAKWRERLTESFGGNTNVAPEELAVEEVVSWDEIATIFARNVTAATAAGGILLSGGEAAKEAALSATRSGLDLQELKELIDKFL